MAEEKRLQQRTKEMEERAKKKEETRRRTDTRKEVKKWKGKDWFAILAPEMFGESFLLETPCTDPKSIIGRNIEVSLSQILNKPSRFDMKLRFRISKIEGKNAHTRFNGIFASRERYIRKGVQKVETISDLRTKDGWEMQAKTIAVLNRNVHTTVQKKVRAAVNKFLQEFAGRSTLDEFVKTVIAGVVQNKIRKLGNKIYPVRISEINKIEVIKVPGK